MNDYLFVFDTNAFISAILLSKSVSAHALDKALKTGKVIVSDATLSEFTNVLWRKKFDKYLTDERRLQIIQKLERDTLLVDVHVTINTCRDEKDNKFLELAVAGAATCIITGDKDLLILNPFDGIPIISAAYFLLNF